MFKCAVQIRGKETLNKIKAYAIINLSGQSKYIYINKKYYTRSI